MTEHYTTNTESVMKWCNRCGRLTQHRVSSGRVGRCTEHEAPAMTKAQVAAATRREQEKKNPRLF